MSGEEKAAESDGESSSKSWVRRIIGKSLWSGIAVVSGLALMQVYFWGLFFFFDKRVSNALFIIPLAINVFVLTVLTALFAGWAAKRSNRDYWPIIALVVYAFLLIVENFADLYWIMGTRANFGVELSRWDAIYFALGTLTTAGTGTIAPTSDLARAIVSGQMILDLVFVTYALTTAVTRWGERSS
jgi:hypothetical protein